MKLICPAPGCEEPIDVGMYACRRDWFRLPAELRRRIKRTWAMRLGDPRNPERIDAHEEAKLEGDEWLQQNTEPKQQRLT